jgi:hypothetical protein
MPSSDYDRIACAITYLQHNVTAQPAAFAALRLSTTTMTSAGSLLRLKKPGLWRSTAGKTTWRSLSPL